MIEFTQIDFKINNSQSVFSKLIPREEIERKGDALHRLFRYVSNKDENKAKGVFHSWIERLPKDESFLDFGTKGDKLSVRVLTCPDRRRALLKARRRLVAYLNGLGDGFHYRIDGEVKFDGDNHYNYCSRSVSYLEENDKKIALKRKIAGRKSALTRAKNKMDAIRGRYATTLFPDEYVNDPRYVALKASLPKKEARLSFMENLSIDDIPALTSELWPEVSFNAA